MQANSIQKLNTIRFRRWSRAGYAIFCSLQSNVSIGRLAISVSEKSLLKSSAAFFSSILSYTFNSELVDNLMTDDESDLVLQQIRLVKAVTISADFATSCCRQKIYLFNHQSG